MFWLAEVFNGSFSEAEMRRAEQWARRERAATIQRMFAGAGRGLARAAKAAASTLRNRHERRRAARDLVDLDDHLLADIGLNRDDVRLLNRGKWPTRLAEPVEPRRLKVVKGGVRGGIGAGGDDGSNDWQRAA